MPQDIELRSLWKWCDRLYQITGNITEGCPFPEGTQPLPSDDDERLYQKINRMLQGPRQPTYYFGEIAAESTVVNGDPLAPSIIIEEVQYGLVPYALTATNDITTRATTLSWTFPSTFTPTPHYGDGKPVFPVVAIYIQRANAVWNMPWPAPVNDKTLAEIATAVAQTGWTTIHTLGPINDLNSLPTTYVDTTVPPNHIAIYRLIGVFDPYNPQNH